MMVLKLIAIGVWLMFSCLIVFALMPFALLGLDLNHTMGYVFGPIAMRLAGVKVERVGSERLDPHTPSVIMCNHQSMFDFAVCCIPFAGRCVVVGKKELYYIPVFNLFFYLAGHIAINRQKRDQSIQSLDEAAAKIRERQISIWIFPEGTRNQSMTGLLPFKKGPFYLALKSQVPVRPILISSYKSFLDLDNRRFGSATIQIKVLPPISTEGMSADKKEDVDKLMTTVRAKMLEGLSQIETRT